MFNSVEIYDREIVQVNSDGSIIQEYPDIETASRIFFVSSKKLLRVCVKKNTSIKFLKSYWFFKNDYNDEIKGLIIKGKNEKSKLKYINNSKSIVKMDLKGNIIESFKNIDEACSKDSKISYNSVYKTCIGLQNTHRNFIWLFEDECNDEVIKNRKRETKSRNCKTRVLQINKKYEIINIFDNMKDASSKLNISYQSITKACNYSVSNIRMVQENFLVQEKDYLQEKDVILKCIDKKLKSKFLDINPIYYLNRDGEIIEEFSCIKDASNKTGEKCSIIKSIADAQSVAVYLTGHRWAYKSNFNK